VADQLWLTTRVREEEEVGRAVVPSTGAARVAGAQKS